MTTVGPPVVTREWVARLASLVHELRPDWQEPGIRSALTRVADRPLIDVAAAAIAASRRTDQRTPAIIAADGSHWAKADTQRTYTEPGVVTYCEHGEPGMRCTECYPRKPHTGTGPTPEQRQAMRDAVAAGRAKLARIEQANGRRRPTGQPSPERGHP